jgi:Rrf2 family cysteine metabolism transcriptional repressor
MRAALAGQQSALTATWHGAGLEEEDRVRMKISAKSEYACLAVLALARHGRLTSPLRVREISGMYGIPERYLVQILLQLKHAGLVSSTRGAAGGYRLAREASSISLGEVLGAVDAPETMRKDLELPSRSTSSILNSVWEDVRAAERAVLDGKTIAHLAEQCSAQEWVI